MRTKLIINVKFSNKINTCHKNKDYYQKKSYNEDLKKTISSFS